jgi:hypothetical protein
LGCRCQRRRQGGYAWTTPGVDRRHRRGRRRRSDARSTKLDVTYDLSALTPHGAAELDVCAAGYEQDIGAWEAAIETALANDSGR